MSHRASREVRFLAVVISVLPACGDTHGEPIHGAAVAAGSPKGDDSATGDASVSATGDASVSDGAEAAADTSSGAEAAADTSSEGAVEAAADTSSDTADAGDGAVTAGAWLDMAETTLHGRFGHGAVWTGTEMLVWGGYYGNTASGTPLGDGAAYHRATNSWRPLPATTLAARSFHTAVWTGSRMLIWGGDGGGYQSPAPKG